MLLPNEQIIFEIPIYSMPYNEFEKRWDSWKQKWRDRSEDMGRSLEETEEVIELIMISKYPSNQWKYNQIVGYVEIAINSRDVIFNVQRTLDRRIRAVSSVKHFIRDMHTNGMHFPIGTKDNRTIAYEIDQYLDSIQKGLPKPMCLYTETFNNLKNHIDFRGIQTEIKSKTFER